MKKGLMSLSKEAVEKSRSNYPANAPQRQPARPANPAALPKSVPLPHHQQTLQPTQAPLPPREAPAEEPAPRRSLASGFLREAMSSHSLMAARARAFQQGEAAGGPSSRTILSPAPGASQGRAVYTQQSPQSKTAPGEDTEGGKDQKQNPG